MAEAEAACAEEGGSGRVIFEAAGDVSEFCESSETNE